MENRLYSQNSLLNYNHFFRCVLCDRCERPFPTDSKGAEDEEEKWQKQKLLIIQEV